MGKGLARSQRILGEIRCGGQNEVNIGAREVGRVEEVFHVIILLEASILLTWEYCTERQITRATQNY